MTFYLIMPGANHKYVTIFKPHILDLVTSRANILAVNFPKSFSVKGLLIQRNSYVRTLRRKVRTRVTKDRLGISYY